MKLTIEKRADTKKSTTRRLRAQGFIPAVIYGKGQETLATQLSSVDFEKAMVRLEKGSLPTTVFTLESPEGSFQAVVKDIQYHPTTYKVAHLDFERLEEANKVRVKVPIRCKGAQDSAGVKQGGVLRQVIRYLPVECYPKDLPKEFHLDVSDLQMKQGKRLRFIALPEGVRSLADLNEVAVIVAKR